MMTDPKTQLVAAAALTSTPWWSEWLGYVHQFASTIAVVTGAIIGILTTIKMYYEWRERKKKDGTPSS